MLQQLVRAIEGETIDFGEDASCVKTGVGGGAGAMDEPAPGASAGQPSNSKGCCCVVQ